MQVQYGGQKLPLVIRLVLTQAVHYYDHC